MNKCLYEEAKELCDEFNKFKETMLGELTRRVRDLETKVDELQNVIKELKTSLDFHCHVGEIKFMNPR